MCDACRNITGKHKRMTYWQLADVLLKTDFKFVSPFVKLAKYPGMSSKIPEDKVLESMRVMPPQTWPWTFWAEAIEGVENVDDVFIALFDEAWTFVKNQANAEIYAHHHGNDVPENWRYVQWIRDNYTYKGLLLSVQREALLEPYRRKSE